MLKVVEWNELGGSAIPKTIQLQAKIGFLEAKKRYTICKKSDLRGT